MKLSLWNPAATTEKYCYIFFSFSLCQDAFESLKNAIDLASIFAYPRFRESFIVGINAVNIGIGGILLPIQMMNMLLLTSLYQ